MARCLRSFSTLPGKVLMNGKSLSDASPSSLQLFRDVPPLRDFRHSLLLSSMSVGLVPTMGALHAGHLSLIRQAAQENTNVFVSVYVNPTQFGVNEDLDSYPRTWDADLSMLQELDEEFAGDAAKLGRISAVFAPSTKTMYPTLPPSSDLDGKGSFVNITPLGSILEGASRPVFFRGVATVCMKLFNIVTPERVYFGQKDVQQTVVIKRMVKDLHIDTEVRIGPTMRDDDGLAMSSRNVYLGTRRRSVALVLQRALKIAEEQYARGKRTRSDILSLSNDLIHLTADSQEQMTPDKRARFEAVYLSLADPDSLEEVQEVDERRGAILSGAIKMDPLEALHESEDCGVGGGVLPVRLIDNVILQPRI
ncbi:MAG: pantothenate synthase [Pycnora praestabilis]|nr:MAG: pantothenate synthase [Pycnora praestabilis]